MRNKITTRLFLCILVAVVNISIYIVCNILHSAEKQFKKLFNLMYNEKYDAYYAYCEKRQKRSSKIY
jgi:hypothetical protein